MPHDHLDAISVLLNLFRGQNTWKEPMAGWRVIPDSRAGTPPGCGIPRSCFQVVDEIYNAGRALKVLA